MREAIASVVNGLPEDNLGVLASLRESKESFNPISVV